MSKQGKALGTWNSIGPFAGMIGPFIAGFLIDYVGWRAVFGPVLLVGLISIFVVQRQIPSTQPHVVRSDFFRTFDWGGVILLSVMLLLLVFYASSRPITGVAALQDWRLLAGAMLSCGGFILWEKRRVNPFVTLEIFVNENFTLASLCAGSRMFTMAGIGFLIPLYLTDVHTLRATSIGIITTLNAGALLTTMRIGGQLADHWSSRWPVVIGSSVQAGSAAYFAWLPETAPLSLIATGMAGHGLGAGLSSAALHRVSMNKIPPEKTGIAAGLYSMIRFSGSVLGVALGGVMLQAGLNKFLLAIEAYQRAFRFIAGVALSGVVIALKLKD